MIKAANRQYNECRSYIIYAKALHYIVLTAQDCAISFGIMEQRFFSLIQISSMMICRGANIYI